MTGGRVFTIDPGTPFLPELAEGSQGICAGDGVGKLVDGAGSGR